MSDWTRLPVKAIAREIRTTIDPADMPDPVYHYSIPVFDETGAGQMESPADIGSSKLLLAGGEILISKLNPRISRVLQAEPHDAMTVASTEFIAIALSPGIDPRFMAYLLASEQKRQFLDGATLSVTRSQQRVRPEVLLSSQIDLPPLDEQRAIADYLDRETARINALIAAKEQTRSQLSERWQLVMQHAVAGRVTVGNTARRRTTLPWLADLPAHWDEALLKLVAKLGSGHTPSRHHPEWWMSTTIPWITTGEVAQVRSDDIEYISETREKISKVGMANSAAVLHPAGTVVLCRTASAGYSGIMASDMATSQDFATWTCGPRLRPRFLLLCLRAMRQDLLGRLAMGSTHKTIYMPDIESIKVPLPPVEEQDRIVEAAHAQHRITRDAGAKLGRQLSLLRERRQALITAAVTGQFEVSVAA